MESFAGQAEEKWRADVLEQVYKIRELLERLVEMGERSHGGKYEATSDPQPIVGHFTSSYEYDSTVGHISGRQQ